MDTIFSKKEQNIRKWWLAIFLFAWIYSSFMFLITPANHVPTGYAGLAIDLLVRIAMYHFAYRKMGTKWLTASIWLSCFGLIALLFFAIASMIGNNPFLQQMVAGFWTATLKIGLVRSIAGYLVGLAFLYANIQLRKINKMRKKPQITIISA